MVRVLHAFYDSLVHDGWSEHYNSDGNNDMQLHSTVAAGQFKHVVSQFTFICRKFRKSHPLGIFYGENPLDYSFSLFLFDMIFIILVIRLVRLVLKPLKQPKIVAEIIGGIIVGPSVLGRNKKFTEIVFPDNAKYVISNLGLMGFMFFLFLAGVKMDFRLIERSGKKHWYTAVIGVFSPMIAVGTIGYLLRSTMDRSLGTAAGIGGVCTNLSITAYPVIYLILKELNLLSSEIGRMALSSAIIGDVMGIGGIVVFEALKQAESSNMNAVWYVISSIVIGAFLGTVVRRTLKCIVKKTPEGMPVSQNHVVLIFLAVLVMGFFTDMFGLAIANGSLWLGLVLPDGPPLGATMVERCETIVMEVLMPTSFAFIGLFTDVSAMVDYGWSGLVPLFIMVMAGYLCKIVATIIVALYFGSPWKDCLTLSLIMSLRGQVELVVFMHWIDKRIIGIPMFTMLVLVTVVATGIFTPLISILYDPTKPYRVNKRRTIQHTPPGSELRLVVCIHDKETISTIIKFLEISRPTQSSPLCVFALRLIELIGRCNPLLIDHQESPKEAAKYSYHETIENALIRYQKPRKEFVKLHTFTAATAMRSMYQDICELALTTKATMIILPFDETHLDNLAGTEIIRRGHGHGVESLNCNVLAHSPCSVGIFVDKGNNMNLINRAIGHSFRRSTKYKYVMLFLGGADAREALVYADRMTENPDVSLMVVRFLAYNNEGDDEIEKKLDDGVVTSFWVKNENNERVVYREVIVRDGEETIAAIQALNDNNNELWIVGRSQGINPVLIQGLTNWSKNHELGVIGDFVSSVDFGGNASVLVVHQQVMREQRRDRITKTESFKNMFWLKFSGSSVRGSV